MEKQAKVLPSDAETRNTIVESVLRERLRPLVNLTDGGCWEWASSGVGIVPYRLIYRLFKGDFNPQLKLLHSCDNPRCVNPEHLHPGTHKQNMTEMVLRGRTYKGGPRHPSTRKGPRGPLKNKRKPPTTLRKLSLAAVLDIRACFEKAKLEKAHRTTHYFHWGMRKLALKYNVSCGVVVSVAQGKTYFN